MTIKVIDAIEMCESRIDSFKEKCYKIEKKINTKPRFVIINASDDEANARYIKGKVAEGEKSGLVVDVIKLQKNCTDDDIKEIINDCNTKKIPVILQLPTFKHLNSESLIKQINYNVDADGFSKEWIGEVNLGNDRLIAPATPKGVISLLEYHQIDIKGKVALVIGKSNHVGKPLCSMLINRGATLINANSSTKDLKSLVRIADIVISCVGKNNLLNANDFKENSIVIGVGFTYIGGKQILDFDLDKVVNLSKVSVVSNRINCTGKATINSLIENVIELYNINYNVW